MDVGYGDCELENENFRRILEESFACFEGERYLFHAGVVMPNHVHLLFSLTANQSLARVVGGWKKFTARVINGELGTEGAFWQRDYFDRIIRDWDHFANVLRDIRSNPAKANLSDGEFTCWEADWVSRRFK